MSGGMIERVGEPTLADHVARIRNINFQLGQWGDHIELGDLMRKDLEKYRQEHPDAAIAYDAEVAARHQAMESLGQRVGEVLLPETVSQ